jgi:hypothetical protein
MPNVPKAASSLALSLSGIVNEKKPPWDLEEVFDSDKTGIVKIITVINTGDDTTSITTSLVDVYKGLTPPPLTNSDGTALEVATYTFNGKVVTTTMYA